MKFDGAAFKNLEGLNVGILKFFPSMYDAEIIAMRPNRAMWPLDSDDDGGGVEMIEHDDGMGGEGGNCEMLS